MKKALIIGAFRLYLRTLALFSPRLGGRAAYRLFSTPRTRRPVPTSVESVMAMAERFDLEVECQTAAAYRWPATSDTADAPRVMLVHGWESRAARLAVWVEPLRAAGFEVVAFDALAHGESAGKQSNPGVFVACMHALVERIGPVRACVAHSLGGLSTLIATGDHDLDVPHIDIDRLVVIAGADSGVDAMTAFCRVLGLGEAFVPLVLAAAAADRNQAVQDFDGHRVFTNRAIPTLWLHDPEDPEVLIDEAKRVVATCPHVTLEEVHGLGHHKIARDPQVIERGVAFLSPLTHPTS
ncbi:MAG: alpha/beta fold hydrolase [Acidobacteriota bacterium]